MGLLEIVDGTSNTFMVGERDSENCEAGAWVGNRNPNGCGWMGSPWTLGIASNTVPLNPVDCTSIGGAPDGGDYSKDAFSSQHPTGANFLLSDASVRFISDTIGGTTYGRLANRGDGNVVSDF